MSWQNFEACHWFKCIEMRKLTSKNFPSPIDLARKSRLLFENFVFQTQIYPTTFTCGPVLAPICIQMIIFESSVLYMVLGNFEYQKWGCNCFKRPHTPWNVSFVFQNDAAEPVMYKITLVKWVDKILKHVIVSNALRWENWLQKIFHPSSTWPVRADCYLKISFSKLKFALQLTLVGPF